MNSPATPKPSTTLFHLRRATGLNPASAAARLGVSTETLFALEQGRLEQTPEAWCRVFQALVGLDLSSERAFVPYARWACKLASGVREELVLAYDAARDERVVRCANPAFGLEFQDLNVLHFFDDACLVAVLARFLAGAHGSPVVALTRLPDAATPNGLR